MAAGRDESLLTISEMAKICRVSRQTLIYYDNNDIFKPEFTDDHGYRFYSVYQVPFLREICALKEKNFSLKDIVENLKNRNLETFLDLLKIYQQNIDSEIAVLQKKKQAIDRRISYYQNTKKELLHVKEPYIKQFPERKFLFCEWGTEEMNRKQMHLTHMKLRNRADDLAVKVDFGWGAMLKYDSIKKNTPLKHGGGYVVLPEEFENTYDIPPENYIVMPAGYFVCMNVYAMPYDTSVLDRLLGWIADNHYSITGDLIDECILDTTFYNREQTTDFCQLQVPVRIPGLYMETEM